MRLKKQRPLITLKEPRVPRKELEQALPKIIREHRQVFEQEVQLSQVLKDQLKDLMPKVEQLAGVLGETQDYLSTLPEPANEVEKWVRARLLQRIGRMLEMTPRTPLSTG